jgi:hypothetical protein
MVLGAQISHRSSSNLVIFIGVMDMLENTDGAGGKTDRIAEV